MNIVLAGLNDYELKERYGWLAAVVASLILMIGRFVYGVFRIIYGVIVWLASRV